MSVGKTPSRRLYLIAWLALYFAFGLGMSITRANLVYTGTVFVLHVLAFSVVQSQSFLLAVWVVFGCEQVLIRFLRAALLLALLNAGPVSCLPSDMSGRGVAAVFAIQIEFFVIACVIFVLARVIARWRIVTTEAGDADGCQGRAQFRLWELFELIALAAVVCFAVRGLPESTTLEPYLLLFLSGYAVAGCVLGVSTLPFVLYSLSPRRQRKFVRLAMFAVLVTFSSLFGMTVVLNSFRHAWSAFWQALVATLGFYGGIAGSLWLARRAGLRLLRIDLLSCHDPHP